MEINKLQEQEDIYFEGLMEFVKPYNKENQKKFLKLLCAYVEVNLELEGYCGR